MKIKLSIYTLCFTTLIYLVLSVAVSGLIDAFPETSPDTLLLLLSSPSLIAVIGIALVPIASRRFSEKAIAVFGLLLMLAGGVICLAFPTSLFMLFLACVLLGIAYGVVSTMFPLIANAHFTGAEKDGVMGVASGMIQLGRLVTVLIGGYLADFAWHYVYFVFLFVAAGLILVWIALPGEKAANQRGEAHFGRVLRDPKVLTLSLTGFCFAVVYFVNATHASLYIEDGGLGSASVTGAISAFGCLFAAVLSFFFAPIYRRTGAYSFGTAALILGAGYALTGCVHAVWSAALGLAASSAAISLFTPCLMIRIGEISTPETAPTVAAVVLSTVNIGYTVSPYIINSLSKLFGGTAQAAFLSAGLASLALGLTLLLSKYKDIQTVKEK